MLVFNKYRRFPLFKSTLRDLEFLIDNYIDECQGNVTFSLVVVVGSSWSHIGSYPYTILQVDEPFPFSQNPNLFPFFLSLPGHLYFNPGEELSLRFLYEDLIRGDLSSYESPQLSEEEI